MIVILWLSWCYVICELSVLGKKCLHIHEYVIVKFVEMLRFKYVYSIKFLAKTENIVTEWINKKWHKPWVS